MAATDGATSTAWLRRCLENPSRRDATLGVRICAMEATVWTIGHSTRTIEDFLAVLSAYGIEAIADVRRFPGSRRLPQFSSAALEQALSDAGIAYLWLPSLGGRRRP